MDQILQGADDEQLHGAPSLDTGQGAGRLLVQVGAERIELLQSRFELPRRDLLVDRFVGTQNLVPYQLLLALLFLQAAELGRHLGSLTLQCLGSFFELPLEFCLPLLQLAFQFTAFGLGGLQLLLILLHQAGDRLLPLGRRLLGLAAEGVELGFHFGALLRLEGQQSLLHRCSCQALLEQPLPLLLQRPLKLFFQLILPLAQGLLGLRLQELLLVQGIPQPLLDRQDLPVLVLQLRLGFLTQGFDQLALSAQDGSGPRSQHFLLSVEEQGKCQDGCNHDGRDGCVDEDGESDSTSFGCDGKGIRVDLDPVAVDHLVDLPQDFLTVLGGDIFNVQALLAPAYQTQSNRLAVDLEGSLIQTAHLRCTNTLIIGGGRHIFQSSFSEKLRFL